MRRGRPQPVEPSSGIEKSDRQVNVTYWRTAESGELVLSTHQRHRNHPIPVIEICSVRLNRLQCSRELRFGA